MEKNIREDLIELSITNLIQCLEEYNIIALPNLQSKTIV
jgi:hypothetical protein